MRSLKNGRLISRRSVEHVANQAHAMTNVESLRTTALITRAANATGFATAKLLASRGVRVGPHCLRRAFRRFGRFLACAWRCASDPESNECSPVSSCLFRILTPSMEPTHA